MALIATPNAGYQFDSWSGACSGSGACVITMDGDKTVTARFKAITYTLTVNNGGNGVVKSSDNLINCGMACSATYNQSAVVSLTATPNTGYVFAGWTGACTGTRPCTVTMNENKTISATFTKPVNYVLTVTRPRNGTVKSSDNLINCGTACSVTYPSGSVVSLTATSAAGYVFTGWSGACMGIGTCNVTMTAAKTVTATFAKPVTYKLTVTKQRNGVVKSIDNLINCGSTCYATYPNGSVVSLTAIPNTGYHFSGWGGACTGTGACTVTMSTNESVTATFSK